MQDLYTLISDTSVANFKRNEIHYFDDIIKEYPNDYRKIITYINECYNYRSPLIVEEKDWGMFLRERFRANKIEEELREEVMELNSPVIVTAIDKFLQNQKEPTFQTLVAKQNLRMFSLGVVQNFNASINDKQKANEMITALDAEINFIHERMRADQKKFGNYKGIDQVQAAKQRFKIGLANFIKS